MTYDKKVKALLAARQEVIERETAPDIAAPAAPLFDNPDTAPFAADAEPLFKMLRDTPYGSQDLANALVNTLPRDGQGSDTTRAADFALMRVKFATITDRLIAPENRKAASAIFDKMYDMATTAKTIDQGLLAKTTKIATGPGSPDQRATAIINEVRSAIGGNPATDRRHGELIDMALSWQVFESSFQGSNNPKA
ncbi:hypothetical protein [Sphingomonas fuzhouensis]|uniref:hypothetical protein n=1 Tax=Sphingomonas fuzhouensis TaxID=3106033 RepID=UPI002AFEBE9D|nr:hypothetical protein [Sphingomonas sp. SGZ-02]